MENIGENIRLIESIIKYANTKQIPGLILFVDLKKAFDSIKWPFIERTLKYLNFGVSLVTWFKLFYTVVSKTTVGLLRFFLWVAEWDRGTCFPPIFILCSEVLDNAVGKDENSHGINSTKVECKLSQYADDTTTILDRSKLSLTRTLYLITWYF